MGSVPIRKGNLAEAIDHGGDALGVQQSADQIFVLAGSAHGDGERLLVQQDLERCFSAELLV